MGADIIGWRNCSLQAGLGPEGFLQKLKMRAYQRAIESQVPPDKLETVQVTLMVNGAQRPLKYADLKADVASFTSGIPECARCPLAGGSPLGCYRYVSYPIDALFEEVAFAFFVDDLATKDSISDQLWRDIVSQMPSQDSGWHDRRGEDPQSGHLSKLPNARVHTWSDEQGEHRVDSAQLMMSLFQTLDSLPLMVAYTRFWLSFFQYVEKSSGDGPIHSHTLEETRSIRDLMVASLDGAIHEGWMVLADA